MAQPLFYKKQPIFGLDIGHGNLKVVQLTQDSDQFHVAGYGTAQFPDSAIVDGIITEPKQVAKAAFELLTHSVVGGISTRRVASSIPVAQSFTRLLTLNKMNPNELRAAVQLEAEQYIPVPLEDLYLDYESFSPLSENEDEIDVLMVAAPSKIVDSYQQLYDMLGLDLALLETTLISSVRGVQHSLAGSLDTDTPPTLLIDFGARSSDLSIFDKSIRVTGTMNKGGDDITGSIAKTLGVPERKAATMKIRYGIENNGQHQAKMKKAVEPILDELVREVKKMQRYYESRASSSRSTIENIILLGGGANLPGFASFLSEKTGLSATVCDPWKNIDFNRLQQPHSLETTLYTTAVGLALAGAGVNND